MIQTLLQLYNLIGSLRHKRSAVYVTCAEGEQALYYIDRVAYVTEVNAVVIFAGERVQ